MKRQSIDVNIIVVSAIAVAAVSFLVGALVSLMAMIATATGLVVVVLLVALNKSLRINARQQDNLYHQVEAMTNLNLALQPRTALPSMRGYAGSPDFLMWLYREIQARAPKVIVEASSGVSTLVCGYALQQLGEGKVVSLEHHEFFAGISQNNLVQHQVNDVAQVIHAPLIKHSINGEQWQWYDFAAANLPEKIDMLVIDGPPRRTQPLARYPALPLLHSRLADDAVILIDDAARADERAMVKRWQQEYPNLTVVTLPAEKGLTVVRLTKP
ncbi:MAG: class I SAM-dependent methyltransferase [Gammaproteobacteria bacterium]|nr:class I SAM-dependent methyltransferase [Gammaproteobacteria bacterium]